MATEDLARSISRRMSMDASSDKIKWASASIREVFDSPGGDLFNQNGREEDEEDLKWAAIERLPTYNRLRHGMIKQVHEDGNVVHKTMDVSTLGVQDKKNFIESILRVVEEDNERLLRRVRDRTDRVGISIPKVEVRFQNLSVEGDAYIGSRSLPTLSNAFLNTIEEVLRMLRLASSMKKTVEILHKVNGVLKPSRLTLLLGPPGSGKTTLLKALAGVLEKDLRVAGQVTYCGHDMSEFIPQRTCAYISQHDLHHGELTVRETLDFSGRFLGVGTRYDLLSELSRREKDSGIKPDVEIDAFMKATALSGQHSSLVTDYVLKILGLDICADIMVGDVMRRGISGGQKKRVTTGEMLVGPAKVFFMDDISTGLDSSTTFQIVKYMRQMVHIMDEVTSRKDQEQYWYKKNETYHYVSVPEFVDQFASFHVGQRITDDLSVPYDRSQTHPAALVKERYGISNMELLKASFAREWLLMKRNSFLYIFKTFQITIMSIIAFTVFFKSEMPSGRAADGSKFFGALFFGLTNVMFNGAAELGLTLMRLPVFFKQRDSLFFPAWAFAIPIWVLRIPISVMESLIWTILTYYTIGFAPDATRFLCQLLAYVGVNQMALSLFRFIAAVSRIQVVSNSLGTFAMLLVLLLGGFIVAKDDIVSWMKWGYYISPLMYGQNAIAVNEFLDERWNDPNTDTRIDQPTVGKVLLASRGMFVDGYMYWICVFVLFAYSIFLNILFILALTYLNPFGSSKSVVDKDANTKKKNKSTDRSSASKAPLNKGVDMGVRNTPSFTSDKDNRRGMLLPFKPLSLAFEHVNYYVDMPPEMKSQGI
ncbi:ABC transporter domain-containing protein [Heracleum sosnowskyi]|nr:ABC transporter domain-containing protein [Heracleum sosnowskyi]